MNPLAALLDPPGPPLRPGRPDPAMRARLETLSVEMVCDGGQPVDDAAARACLAGLWLGHGFLDESHRISQELDSAEGSWWHGIMHRCEGDFANAAYWFRRVGDHPLLRPLAADVGRALAGMPGAAEVPWLAAAERWDPIRFTDLCAAVVAGRTAHGGLAQVATGREWHLLFDHCRRRALGRTG